MSPSLLRSLAARVRAAFASQPLARLPPPCVTVLVGRLALYRAELRRMDSARADREEAVAEVLAEVIVDHLPGEVVS